MRIRRKMRLPRDLPVLLLAATLSVAVAQPARFEIAGVGQLATVAPAQTNGRFALTAQLSAASDSSTSLPAQTGARYTMTAQLTTASLVCYSDTIFRDDFDGDGF